MKIEDIVQKMRGFLEGGEELVFADMATWADALEQHMKDHQGRVQGLTIHEWVSKYYDLLSEAGMTARLGPKDVRQFNPPPEVIEAWPEDDYDWVIYDLMTKTWCWVRYMSIAKMPVGYDPRTLHHRSKFYQEES